MGGDGVGHNHLGEGEAGEGRPLGEGEAGGAWWWVRGVGVCRAGLGGASFAGPLPLRRLLLPHPP